MVAKDSVTLTQFAYDVFGNNASQVLTTAAVWGPYVFGAGAVDTLAIAGIVLSLARKTR